MNFLKYNNNNIIYTIDKTFTKNIDISIQNGQIAVNAPWFVSKRKIEKTILEKKFWILQKLKEYEEQNVNYEEKTIKVFGEYYNLKISYKLIKSPELYLEGKTILIELPSKLKNTNNAKIIDLIIEKFYLKMAENEIEKVMEKMRIKFGFAPEDYQIKKMDRILGKYEEKSRNIIINPEIIKFDKEVLEYVVLHEFCHLKYKTHCKSFYKLIEKDMKNYKSIENRINGIY